MLAGMTKIGTKIRKNQFKTCLLRLNAFLLSVFFLVSLSGNIYAQSPQDQIFEFGSQPSSDTQIDSYADDTAWYDPTAAECGATAGPNLATTGTQDEHARTIIGVAKTMGLGEEGALIGLMTALVESGLKNNANDGSWEENGTRPYEHLGPISLAIPHDAVGNDHDSVGLMQQRAVDGNWGPVDPDENLEENVQWLMTPSYAAFAFFRALVNLDEDWRSLEPGVAAQRVQVSAFPDRYAERQADAQSYLDRLWPSAPAVALPDVPAAQGVGGQGEASVCPVVSGTPQQRILQTINLYAWPTYCGAGQASCPGRDGGALTAKPEYRDAIRAAASRGEYIGDRCGFDVQNSNNVGADCGGFVTRVMRDSGVDPDYNTDPQGNTTGGQWPYLRRAVEEGKYIEVPDSQPLQPGDIAINDGHTYFYVGDGMQSINPNWEGDSASASQCERTAMAGPNDTRSNYTWYRFAQGEVSTADTRSQPGVPKPDHQHASLPQTVHTQQARQVHTPKIENIRNRIGEGAS
jgi:hypothetical protein